MLDMNFTHFIGRPIATSENDIRDQWIGSVVVLPPTSVISSNLIMSRLQVHVDDQGIITRIVNG